MPIQKHLFAAGLSSCLLCLPRPSEAAEHIHVGSCSGAATKYRTNLIRACKDSKYRGQVLVKCRHKCVKRKGLKCKRRAWVVVKSASCTEGGKRIKMKKCNVSETNSIHEALGEARKAARALQAAMGKIPKCKLGSTKQNQWDKSKKRLGKVIGRLGQRFKIKCGDRRGLCKKHDRYGWSIPVINGRTIHLCEPFFAKDPEEGARAIIHEVSHKFFATDGGDFKTYWGQGDPPTTAKHWWNIADTYNYWLESGLCVPNSRGCTPVQEIRCKP